jgi:hypothetical protein
MNGRLSPHPDVLRGGTSPRRGDGDPANSVTPDEENVDKLTGSNTFRLVFGSFRRSGWNS